MFKQTKEIFSIRKLKSGGSDAVKIGAIVAGATVAVGSVSVHALANNTLVNAEPKPVIETAVQAPVEENQPVELTIEQNVTEATGVVAENGSTPTPIDPGNISVTPNAIPVDEVTLGNDVSAKVTDKTTNSQILGGTTLNHFSLFYNEYNGKIDNADRSLKAGDYFKIKLDERVGLDGVTVYNKGYGARPVEEITNDQDEVIIKGYYNKDDHSMYYVFTDAAVTTDEINWTIYTTDTLDHRKVLKNGDMTFTNDYAGTPVDYKGTVKYHANDSHQPDNYVSNVEHVIAEVDVVNQRYLQYFAISPQPGSENFNGLVKYKYGTDGKTPAKNLSLKVYEVPQNTPYNDSFAVEPSYVDVTANVVNGDEIQIPTGFANGKKYLVVLENDYDISKGINSSLTGGAQGAIVVTNTGRINAMEPTGYADTVILKRGSVIVHYVLEGDDKNELVPQVTAVDNKVTKDQTFDTKPFMQQSVTGPDGKVYDLVGHLRGDETGDLNEGTHHVYYQYRLRPEPTTTVAPTTTPAPTTTVAPTTTAPTTTVLTTEAPKTTTVDPNAPVGNDGNDPAGDRVTTTTTVAPTTVTVVTTSAPTTAAPTPTTKATTVAPTTTAVPTTAKPVTTTKATTVAPATTTKATTAAPTTTTVALTTSQVPTTTAESTTVVPTTVETTTAQPTTTEKVTSKSVVPLPKTGDAGSLLALVGAGLAAVFGFFIYKRNKK